MSVECAGADPRTEAAWDDPESNIGLAAKLKEQIPGAVILDQYKNPNNPLAHQFGTYEEIRHALRTSDLRRKDIAALVAGAGTGGTITGLARGQRNAEKEDGVKKAVIVAVDPVGSILGGGEPGNYIVEGIGYVSNLQSFSDFRTFTRPCSTATSR